jgi:hypothetical protein
MRNPGRPISSRPDPRFNWAIAMQSYVLLRRGGGTEEDCRIPTLNPRDLTGRGMIVVGLDAGNIGIKYDQA